MQSLQIVTCGPEHVTVCLASTGNSYKFSGLVPVIFQSIGP